MTTQVKDKVLYRGRTFWLAGVKGPGPFKWLFGVKGSGLFKPERHGLQPAGAKSTACHRGFICTYGVSDGLYLEELDIYLGFPDRAKPLFGKEPRCDPYGNALYEQLHGPVPFTGGLLVVTDFLQERYFDIGTHPAWGHKDVHELLFEEGRLVEAIDCSEPVARAHERLRAHRLEPDVSVSPAEIEQWMKKSFRLDYD